MNEQAREGKNGGRKASGTRKEEGRLQGANPEVQLDEVRDILFGAQTRATDERLHGLEDRLASEVSRLGEQLGSKLAQLESGFKAELGNLKKELAELSSRLDEEQASRRADGGSLERDVHALGDTLSARIAGLDEAKADRGDLADFFSGFANKLTQRPPTGQ